MERATRWTLIAVALAFGAGFGVAAQVWRDAGGFGTAPAAPDVRGPAPAARPEPPLAARPASPPSWAARDLPPTPLLRPPYGGVRGYDAYAPAPAQWAGPAPSPPPRWAGPAPARYGAPRADWMQAPGYGSDDAWDPRRARGETWWTPDFHDGPPPPLPEDGLQGPAWGDPAGQRAPTGLAGVDSTSPWAPVEPSVGEGQGLMPPASDAVNAARMEGTTEGTYASRAWPPAWFPDPWADPAVALEPAPASAAEAVPVDPGSARPGVDPALAWGEPVSAGLGSGPPEPGFDAAPTPGLVERPIARADEPGLATLPPAEAP